MHELSRAELIRSRNLQVMNLKFSVSSLRQIGRTAPTLMLVAIMTLVSSGCSRTDDGKEPIPPLSRDTASAQIDPVADMFLRNRHQLRTPDERIREALRVGLAGFTTPIGGASQEISIDLSIINESNDQGMTILGAIPYQAGDVSTGPGVRLRSLSNESFSLGPGESRSVSIRLLRERVPGGGVAQTTPQAQVDGADQNRSMTGSEDSPFDPAQGLQVLVVVAFSEEVPDWSSFPARVVPDSQFASVYGKFSGYQYGIGLPIERIL